MTALSHAEGLPRDTQYIFSMPEGLESNNVIMSVNVMLQNLKAKDRFPLSFKVFKVRQPASGLTLSDICAFLGQREQLTRLGEFAELPQRSNPKGSRVHLIQL